MPRGAWNPRRPGGARNFLPAGAPRSTGACPGYWFRLSYLWCYRAFLRRNIRGKCSNLVREPSNDIWSPSTVTLCVRVAKLPRNRGVLGRPEATSVFFTASTGGNFRRRRRRKIFSATWIFPQPSKFFHHVKNISALKNCFENSRRVALRVKKIELR